MVCIGRRYDNCHGHGQQHGGLDDNEASTVILKVCICSATHEKQL